MFFIFFLFDFSLGIKIIKIPFEVKPNNLVKSDDLLSELYNVDFYTKIKIGSNKQEIQIPFKLHRFPTYLAGKTTEIKGTKFDESLSITYSQLDSEIFKPREDDFFEGKKSKDNIYLNDIKIENFKFILSTKQNYEESGAIGLKFSSHSSEKEKLKGFNLISQLKEKEQIDNYYFSFKFKNKDKNKGELIIGEAPHEYDSYYNKEKFVNSNLMKSDYDIRWYIKFSEVKIGNESYSKTDICDINLSIGLIEGPFSFKHKIKKKFFKREGCIEENDSKFSYFSCEKKVNIKEFQDLTFTLQNKEMKFTLTYEDLFIEKNGKYYFIILFNIDVNMWRFGYLFLKKYQAVFNTDKQTVSWYNEPEKKVNIVSILLIICIIFAIIIGLLLSYIFIYKPLRVQRKKRANELIEEFDYTPTLDNNNRESKLGI